MLGRFVLTGATLIVMGAAPAMAGQFGLIHWLYHKCDEMGKSSQCAVQIVHGNNNFAMTEQVTGHRRGTQFALTVQKGDGNVAYTGQVGKNQLSLTVQNGNDNGAFTYQEGKYNYSQTIQNTNGSWAATSSIGNGTYTSVVIE